MRLHILALSKFLIIMNFRLVQSNTLDDYKNQVQSLINTDFKPTLALIFASVEQNIEEISKIEYDCDIDVFGISSSGEIINNEIHEFSIVAVFIDITKEAYYLKIEETYEKEIIDITKNLKTSLDQIFDKKSFIVSSSGLSTDGEEVVESIINVFGNDVPLYGALAGDDLKMKKTFVFSNNKVLEKGIIFLVFNNDIIELQGIATSGWESIGVEKVVTKAHGNIIYEIDNQPAVDVFIKYFNVEVDLKESSDVVENIGVKYPLQVLREGRKPVLRAPLYANADDKSLVFAGRIDEGARVKFSVPPTFEIIDSTIEDIKKVKHKIPEADVMLMFSCAARKLALGPMAEDEVEGIRSIWDVPLIGLFTYGEIGNTENCISDFHNETCSVVLLKSKV